MSHDANTKPHLSTIVMDHVTNVSDSFFKHPICWWICDHEASQVFSMLFDLIATNRKILIRYTQFHNNTSTFYYFHYYLSRFLHCSKFLSLKMFVVKTPVFWDGMTLHPSSQSQCACSLFIIIVQIDAICNSWWSAAVLTLEARCEISMLPSRHTFIGSTFIPAICAEAGLVPWADTGMRQMLRCPSERASW